ncbi:MAG: hypothetical protein EBU46_00175 [Nitrosomonadaceae bacterium]|nr:hypothetical protein [Nitrosomonadaceae bacterium]
MEIKQLFIDAASYQRWFQTLLDVNPNVSLWREEDRPKLEPYFQWNDQKPSVKTKMTAEERASFEHYKKCLGGYGRKAAELRDSLRQFCFEELCDIFGFELVEPDNDASDAIKLCDEFPYEFPLIVVGHLDSDYYRGAEARVVAVSIISLNEFNLVVNEEPKLDHDLQPIKNYNEDRDER